MARRRNSVQKTYDRFFRQVRANLDKKRFHYGDMIYADRDANHVKNSLILFVMATYERYVIQTHWIEAKQLLSWTQYLSSDIEELAMTQEIILSYIRSPYEVRLYKEAVTVSPQFMLPLLLRFRKKKRVKTFECINFFCQFISKITLVKTDLEDKFAEKFFDFNQECSSWTYHRIDQNLLIERMMWHIDDLHDYLNSDEAESHFICRFGPGAVEESKKSAGIAPKVKLLREGRAPSEVISAMRMLYRNELNTDWLSGVKTTPHANAAKLTMVPKGLAKKRSITIEPVHKAYAQQGARNWLKHAVDSCSDFHVKLEDQNRNRTLALNGSQNWDSRSGYATIDLSSASDSVTCQLTKRLLCEHENTLSILMALRSSEVKYKGRTEPLHVYAGMGNAITFIWECIVFSCIVMASFDEYYAELGVSNPQYDYQVYGDDIIVPNYLYHTVIKNLELLNFTVNKTKSFSFLTPFRESCGIEAFNGIDVTPFRLSRKINLSVLSSGSVSSDELDSLLDLLNSLFKENLPKTQRLLRQSLSSLMLYSKKSYTKRIKRCRVDRVFSYTMDPDTYGILTNHESDVWQDRLLYKSFPEYGIFNLKLSTHVKSRVSVRSRFNDLDTDTAYWLAQEKLSKEFRTSLALPEDRYDRSPGTRAGDAMVRDIYEQKSFDSCFNIGSRHIRIVCPDLYHEPVITDSRVVRLSDVLTDRMRFHA